MQKDAKIELWQLKVALFTLLGQLNSEVKHLDELTCKTIARVLGEIMQETVSLANNTTQEDIVAWIGDILVDTDEMKEELARKWYEELQPVMQRAEERAEELEHSLGDFTCLSVNGEQWGAICLICLEWVIIEPGETRGNPLLRKCRGLGLDSSRFPPPDFF
ncbi:MAG: hypothetical protein H6658_03245 [Ardenticatenaceae bacterium]|nr:hypothetical protein [Ardenticatenaceae bacterium]